MFIKNCINHFNEEPLEASPLKSLKAINENLLPRYKETFHQENGKRCQPLNFLFVRTANQLAKLSKQSSYRFVICVLAIYGFGIHKGRSTNISSQLQKINYFVDQAITCDCNSVQTQHVNIMNESIGLRITNLRVAIENQSARFIRLICIVRNINDY